MIFFVIAILFGLILLIISADRFIEGAASVAKHLNINPLVIGLLILGFGTSAPEIMVSIFAALSGNSSLAFGNAIGSNITNISLVLGVSAIIGNITIQSSALKKEFPILLSVNIIFGLLIMNHIISLQNSIILLLMLVGILFWMAKSKNNQDNLTNDIEKEIPEWSLKVAWIWAILGLIFLVLSSKLLVWGATGVALSLGISDLVIGLSIVAIGTSLPELAASVMAVLKKEHDMAIGNVIGSNLFNLLAVVGISGIIDPYTIPSIALYRDFTIMITLTIFLYGVLLLNKHTINKTHGLILISSFVVYLIILFKTANL